LQAQLWILSLLSRTGFSPPLYLIPQDHYKLQPLPNSRINYGVDHESYAYQLACDMGTAPSFTELLNTFKSPRLLASWALSANVNPKFRLVGPWKWDGARDVMEGEIWDTVRRRRGFFGHITLSVIPILLFGSLSSLLCVICWSWVMIKFLWKALTLSKI
jgi:dimethylaniline monooxygenase (N-oxide forming)